MLFQYPRWIEWCKKKLYPGSTVRMREFQYPRWIEWCKKGFETFKAMSLLEVSVSTVDRMVQKACYCHSSIAFDRVSVSTVDRMVQKGQAILRQQMTYISYHIIKAVYTQFWRFVLSKFYHTF